MPCDISKPCLNDGICNNDNMGGFTCTCKTGYNGKTCETGNWKINFFFVMNRILTKNPQKALQCVLLKPCLNGGACAEDNKGGYICTCLKGFTGPTCNISNYKLCSHIYLCSNKNQFSKNKYRLSSSNSLIYRLKKC